MILCLFAFIFENYRLLRKSMIDMRRRRAHRSIKRTMDTKIQNHDEVQLKNLVIFQGLTIYTTYRIDNDSFDIVDLLIQKAKKTNMFTILLDYDWQTNKKSMCVEFVQARHSYVVSMPCIFTCPFELQNKIDVLFDHMFVPKNIIQVWGQMDSELMDLIKHRSLSASVFNVQDKFKEWYNEVLCHDHDCPQAKIDIIIDGPACTCIHRPYKSPSAQWSLPRAVQYFFTSYVDLPFDQGHQCRAISVLAKIIRQTWTLDEYEFYMMLHRDNSSTDDRASICCF